MFETYKKLYKIFENAQHKGIPLYKIVNVIQKLELRKTKLYEYFEYEFAKRNEIFPEHYKVIIDHLVLLHNLKYNRDVKSKNLYIYGNSNTGKSRFLDLLRKTYKNIYFSEVSLKNYINKKYNFISFEEFRFTYLPKGLDMETFKMFLEGVHLEFNNVVKNDNPTCIFTSNSNLVEALNKKSENVGLNFNDRNAFANRFDVVCVDDLLKNPYTLKKLHNREVISFEVKYSFQLFVNVLQKFYNTRLLSLKT